MPEPPKEEPAKEPAATGSKTVSRKEYDELVRKLQELRDRVDSLEKLLNNAIEAHNATNSRFELHTHSPNGSVAIPLSIIVQSQQQRRQQ